MFLIHIFIRFKFSMSTICNVSQVIEEASKQILAKVPQPVDIVDLMERHPVLYEESMNTVLQQEVRALPLFNTDYSNVYSST